MPIINGLDSQQILFSSHEDAISADNDVCFIDAFVDKLDLRYAKHVVSHFYFVARSN